MQAPFPSTLRLSSRELAADLSSPDSEKPRAIYLEGTDATGKDCVANNLTYQRQRRFGADCLRKATSAAYFTPDAKERYSQWAEQYSEADHAGLLLAATVLDLASVDDGDKDDLPYVQVSHSAIRGTAYQEAFDLPLKDLFSLTTTILPSEYWPVALTASIPELQRRVIENPLSTPFDFLVFDQPDKVEAIMEAIRERCVALGGKAIDTSRLHPKAVAEHITEEIETTPQPPTHPPRDILATTDIILDELQSRDTAYAPVVNEVKRELYA